MGAAFISRRGVTTTNEATAKADSYNSMRGVGGTGISAFRGAEVVRGAGIGAVGAPHGVPLIQQDRVAVAHAHWVHVAGAGAKSEAKMHCVSSSARLRKVAKQVFTEI